MCYSIHMAEVVQFDQRVAVEEPAPDSSPDPRVEVLQSETADPAERERAFAEIFEAFQGPLVGYARNMVGPNEAEDIVQETFIKAFRAMERFDNQGSAAFAQWLYKITLNTVRNSVRYSNSKSRPDLVAQGLEPRSGVSSASHIGIPGKRLELKEDLVIMGQLADRQRTAVMLSFEDLSYEEIARRMDTTVPSVKSLLVRAKARFAQLRQEAEEFDIPAPEEPEDVLALTA